MSAKRRLAQAILLLCACTQMLLFRSNTKTLREIASLLDINAINAHTKANTRPDSYGESSSSSHALRSMRYNNTYNTYTYYNNTQSRPKMKIVGFTDIGYLPIAKKWYHRLVKLGYNTEEIEIVCHDKESYDKLRADNITSVQKMIIHNPDRAHMVKGFWKQLMMKRLQYTLNNIQANVSMLVTDIDNVFVRHVPLIDLYNDPFDVIHSYATAYPTNVFKIMGFTVCSGHQWLKATPQTKAFLEIVLQLCRSSEKCDDQVAYNMALIGPATITWDTPPNRTNTTRHGLVNNLLVQTLTGKCRATNHTVKVWNRDFAFRSQVTPHVCPSKNNWVAMPVTGSLDTTDMVMPGRNVTSNRKVAVKMATMDKWLQLCGPNGTLPKRAATVTSNA